MASAGGFRAVEDKGLVDAASAPPRPRKLKIRDSRDGRDGRDARDARDARDGRDGKDARPTKQARGEHKDRKDKDRKDRKDKTHKIHRTHGTGSPGPTPGTPGAPSTPAAMVPSAMESTLTVGGHCGAGDVGAIGGGGGDYVVPDAPDMSSSSKSTVDGPCPSDGPGPGPAPAGPGHGWRSVVEAPVGADDDGDHAGDSGVDVDVDSDSECTKCGAFVNRCTCEQSPECRVRVLHLARNALRKLKLGPEELAPLVPMSLEKPVDVLSIAERRELTRRFQVPPKTVSELAEKTRRLHVAIRLTSTREATCLQALAAMHAQVVRENRKKGESQLVGGGQGVEGGFRMGWGACVGGNMVVCGCVNVGCSRRSP